MQTERKRCGAKNRDGTPCKTWAMPNGRCRMHGGKSLAGPASPMFKTGRYSKVLPGRLLARYQEAAQDEELLALREDVALIDARLADVLSRVDTGETGASWQAARAGLKVVRRAIGDNDPVALRKGLAALGDAIDQGAADYAAWGEIGRLLEQRQRLAESERRRLVEMQQMLTAEQAMTFLAAVLDSVRQHVTDRKVLAAVSAELASIAAGPGGRAARSVSVAG